MQTPLAWKNLTSSKSKCVLAATGVGFAVVLMFMQIGFRYALLDSNVQILKLFSADLMVVSRARYMVSAEQRFPRYILDQAAALPGVQSSCAVYVERGTASIQVEHQGARPVRVIAAELKPEYFTNPDFYQLLANADRNNGALVDRRSKSGYHFATTPAELALQHVELNKKTLPLLGQFALGTDFAHDGTVLMSDRMLPTYFPWRNQVGQTSGDPLEVVDIGLLRAPGGDLERLRQSISDMAPQQVQVYLTKALIDKEFEFWSKNTPIGVIFDIGTIMGLIVGGIICYQIQFTDINEHMPEFATLKAMGYRPRYFWGLILCQSFYLACLGFIPGLLIASVSYWALADLSGLIMQMTLERAGFVAALTLAMCVISGALAIRKLFGADPANLF